MKKRKPRKPTGLDRHDQALHALNCAIGCLVAWPPSPQHLGGAVFFTSLALYRMAKTDPEAQSVAWAEKYLEEARHGWYCRRHAATKRDQIRRQETLAKAIVVKKVQP